MKTSELTGATLDYWVAKAEGKEPERFDMSEADVALGSPPYVYLGCGYSSNWEQGGPIIERERITLESPDWGRPTDGEWCATVGSGVSTAVGPTLLVAAMRAYVASKFGEEVQEV